MFDDDVAFAAGDRVTWQEDKHHRSLDHPEAIPVRRTGILHSIWYSPTGSGAIVAYSVSCPSRLFGSYMVTVRPDLGHVLRHDDRPHRDGVPSTSQATEAASG